MKIKWGAMAATVWRYKWRAKIIIYVHCDFIQNCAWTPGDEL